MTFLKNVMLSPFPMIEASRLNFHEIFIRDNRPRATLPVLTIDRSSVALLVITAFNYVFNYERGSDANHQGHSAA